MVPKGLIRGQEESEIGGLIKTIQIIALLRYKRHEETCCHSVSSKRPLANAGVKNSQGVI